MERAGQGLPVCFGALMVSIGAKVEGGRKKGLGKKWGHCGDAFAKGVRFKMTEIIP